MIKATLPDILWREGVAEIDYLKRLIELAANNIIVCTFDDKSIKEMLIVINNDKKISAAIKNILEENKIPFEEIKYEKYFGLFKLLWWRMGFILQKSELNNLEEAFKKTGIEIKKIERKEIKV